MRTVGALGEGDTFHPARSGRTHLRALAMVGALPESRVDEMLDRVELSGVADRRTGIHSHGMRRRLGLAAALLGDPDVLVVDEPQGGLDPQGMRWLRGLMRALADGGRTVLLSSHMLGEVAQVADDVVVVDRGRVVRRGTLADVSGPGDPATAAARLEIEFLRLTTGLAGQDRR
jgi:ABC-2 type transport system ATP-binding protein